MNRSYPRPVDTPSFAGAPPWDRPILWIGLLAAAFGVRLSYVLHGHPAFNADEVLILDHIHAWASGKSADEILTMQKAMDLRLWIPAWIYRLLGNPGDVLSAIAFGLLGHALWVLWAHRWGGAKLALGTALYFVAAPPSIAYYGCLLNEFRMSLVVGALLALGAGRWGRSLATAWGFGFLLAFGTFSDQFTFFFLPSLVWVEWRWGKVDWKQNPVPRALAVFSGLLIGSLLGIYYLSSLPLHIPGHESLGAAGPQSILKNLRILTMEFPSFWGGGSPYGYFQNSAFGSRFFPPDGARARILVWCLAAAGFALSTRGWFRWFSRDQKARLASLPLWGTLGVFLVFFVFSSHTWDALSCRYLYLAMIYWAVGLGALFMDGYSTKTFWTAIAALVLLAGWNVVRITEGPPRNPAWILADELEAGGERVGYANHWAAPLLDYASGGRLEYIPYDALPGSRRRSELVHAAPRIGVLLMDGLDDPRVLKSALQQLQAAGYRTVGQERRDGEWTLLEMERRPGSKLAPQGLGR